MFFGNRVLKGSMFIHLLSAAMFVTGVYTNKTNIGFGRCCCQKPGQIFEFQRLVSACYSAVLGLAKFISFRMYPESRIVQALSGLYRIHTEGWKYTQKPCRFKLIVGLNRFPVKGKRYPHITYQTSDGCDSCKHDYCMLFLERDKGKAPQRALDAYNLIDL